VTVELKGYQRDYLAAAANKLEPAVRVGKHGGSQEVVSALDEALSRLELVKVRFVSGKESREEICRTLEAQTSSTLIRVIGNVGIFYREAKDPDDRQYRIPKR
jgi:RNA-binding protein